ALTSTPSSRSRFTVGASPLRAASHNALVLSAIPGDCPSAPAAPKTRSIALRTTWCARVIMFLLLRAAHHSTSRRRLQAELERLRQQREALRPEVGIQDEGLLSSSRAHAISRAAGW